MNRYVLIFFMLILLSIQLAGCNMFKSQPSPGPEKEGIMIEQNSVHPQKVSAGSTVEAIVQYTVVLPEGLRETTVTETRTLAKGDERINLSKKNMVRIAGSHTSKLRLTVPKDIDKGEYLLIVTISNGRIAKTATSRLKIM